MKARPILFSVDREGGRSGPDTNLIHTLMQMAPRVDGDGVGQVAIPGLAPAVLRHKWLHSDETVIRTAVGVSSFYSFAYERICGNHVLLFIHPGIKSMLHGAGGTKRAGRV